MHLKAFPGSSHGGGGGGGLNWDAGSFWTLRAPEAATEEPSGDSGVGSLDRDSPVDPSSPSDDPVKSGKHKPSRCHRGKGCSHQRMSRLFLNHLIYNMELLVKHK